MRDTAVLYDVENLVEGYGDGLPGRAAAVSFSRIEGLIAGALPPTASFAVKRGYADWSSGGLRPMHRSLVEAGIEPRQVFGFGDGGKTNAADVELVIDAFELAYTCPAITRFVIVSGDGGFGSIVR